MRQDLVYAVRSLLRHPLFALGAIMTLALGIGASTAIFTLAHAMLFRPLPGVAEPDALVWITPIRPEGGSRTEISYPDYLDYREGSRGVFAELMAFRPTHVSVGGDGPPERLRAHFVSGSYFAALGAQPAAGRLLGAGDDWRGAPPTVVLSHRLWMRRFGGADDVLERSLIVGGRAMRIAGVAAKGFAGPILGESAELWIPLAAWPELVAPEAALLHDRDTAWLSVMGRLRDGSNTALAGAALTALARGMEAGQPESERVSAVTVSPAGPVPPAARGEVLPLAGLLLGVTVLVLLIACANVANLMLARGAVRSLELSVRAAIGATRGRLVRQLLTESLVIAVAAGGCGLLLSLWLADLLVSFLPEADFAALDPGVDGWVLLFTAGLACASVTVFGLVPAFTAARAALSPRLRQTPAAGRGRSRLQNGFVVAQLALSLVLLLAAGFSLRALQKASAIDLGFDARHLFTASYDPVLQNYTPARRNAFRSELLAKARALPGVRSAAVANLVPLGGIMISTTVIADGAGGGSERRAFLNAVSPGYFGTLQLPLLRGRGITEADAAGAPLAAVVNETLARQLWPGADPIGGTLRLGSDIFHVVGVAADSKYDEPAEEARPFLYMALAQRSQFGRETLIVRTAGPAALAAPAVEDAIRSLDPALPVFDARSFETLLEDRADKQRAMSALFAAFGLLALALAALGLYGVMAYAVASRTREIGVRLALGASRAQLVSLVTRDGLRLALAGAGIGALLALPVAMALRALVTGVQGGDLVAFAGAIVLLVAVALLASALPARRAARLDPIVALRAE